MVRIINNARRNKALNGVYDDIVYTFTKEYYISEVKRYKSTFPYEHDYNIAQYGNLLVYYDSVRKFLFDCGYPKFMEKFKQKGKANEYRIPDFEVWEFYKGLVRQVADYIVQFEG